MQLVPTWFNALADGDIRPLSWGALISFTKDYDDDIIFFTYNVSEYNGADVYAPTGDNPLQSWDKYEYTDYSERIIYQSVQRELEFPYSVVSAIADFSLNNYDDYFTPNSGSPLSDYIIPKRPVRLLQGFSTALLPQFVGLTQGMPDIAHEEGTATFTAMDFLTQIYSMPIRNTEAMQNVRTDEILANIFAQFGLTPDQYDLGHGRNVVKFLFFEKDQQTAGDVIRPLMQAEGGLLWLSEEGIIKFRPRLEQPTTSSYTFDSDSIITLSVSSDDQIINHVIINTDVREVQDFQTVYSKKTSDNTLNVIPAGESAVFVAELQDPVLTVEEPVYGSNADVSWFTAATYDGTDVTSGVSITSVELKTNTYEMTIENTNGFDVNINQMSIWAQPAKRISVEPIIYENKDQDSIDKYEDKPLEISNNFIQDIDTARSLAITILDEYAEYADIIEMEVKGNPAIQLSDINTVDYDSYSGQYRLIGTSNKLQDSKYTQIIKARGYNPRTWFQYDVSEYNGPDVYAP